MNIFVCKQVCLVGTLMEFVDHMLKLNPSNQNPNNDSLLEQQAV